MKSTSFGKKGGQERPPLKDGRAVRAERLRSRRRSQVEAVARRLFAERGYHETSIQDILDGADIARGTFYLYFDSKRAIFDALVDGFLERIQGVVTVVDMSEGAPPPLTQLEQNLARVMDILRENRDLTHIILRQTEGLDAECDAKMADFYNQILKVLTRALTRGQGMGLVRPCDPLVVAQAALGSLKELVRQWVVARDSGPEQMAHVIHESLHFALFGLFS